MLPRITIFGSCRQTAIASLTPTTDIHDRLNYPHYTSEILQQIRYLKYRNIPEEYTKYCFRSGLLSRCSAPIRNDAYMKMKRDFDNTSLFLVEIASRISYKWNNRYMHHIATEEAYGFYDRHAIEQRDLTDEEIEEDLIQIRNELYPKPFIVISHFATYPHGKRYELTQLLQSICHKFNIPFLNQSDLIAKYGESILVPEPVLAHYTEEGHQIVGKWMMDKIREIVDAPPVQQLYQVYYTSEERVKRYTFHGFGDYIRGVVHLYQTVQGKPVELKVNFSNHHLQSVFVCRNHLSIGECENAKYIFANNPNYDVLQHTHVFTNRFHSFPAYDAACKDFLIRNCFTPRIGFTKKLSNIKQQLSIVDGEYSILHIRLHDNETFSQSRLDTIRTIIQNIQLQYHPNEPFLLLSNSNIYFSHIHSPFLIKTQLARGHVGQNTHTANECIDTMVEFMLMTTSKRIVQLSVYDWGSGFSETAHNIYDVPITRYKIA